MVAIVSDFKWFEWLLSCSVLCRILWLWLGRKFVLTQLLLLLLSRFSRVQLCDPIDGSPPGSPVPGILQARTLEWVAMSFSNAWKWKVKVKSLSHVWLLAIPWMQPTRLLRPWDFPGKSTGVGCHFLLQCMKVKSESEIPQSCPTLATPWMQPTGLLRPWDFPGKSTGVGCRCLLRLTQLWMPKYLWLGR